MLLQRFFELIDSIGDFELSEIENVDDQFVDIIIRRRKEWSNWVLQSEERESKLTLLSRSFEVVFEFECARGHERIILKSFLRLSLYETRNDIDAMIVISELHVQIV